IAAEPPARLGIAAAVTDLAYVIYTSGSTGKPKGVLVRHDNVVRLFHATRAWYDFQPSDVWTLFHSYAFDFSVWELWGALLYGGRVVVVPYLVSRSPDAFYELLGAEGVTVLSQTPSAFRQIIRAEQGAPEAAIAALRLRYVVFGGEALDIGDLRSWWDRHGDERPLLVNMYGITETTVHVTYRPLRQADLARAASSVIGAPIPDLQVYVLDPVLAPVPIGVAGELYIGGAGVASGYLARPELTAARFLPDPFNPGHAARLYRTGDLARRLPSGDLEYRGRADFQVKIRGFRIELGEVEAALDLHPAVREAVALVREDVPGDKRLVAYVVPEGKAPSALDLRASLEERLPEYMIPSAFVFLAALPLTENGKVSRRALPAPDAAAATSERVHTEPRGPVEDELAGIFAEVLRVPPGRVGAHDGFFELGGHSLLATQAISRIRAAFGIALPLAALFEDATVAELAARIAPALHAAPRSEAAPLPPIVPVPRDGQLPMSFGQERLWFLAQLDPGDTSYIVPFTVRFEGA
ncbi:MAG: amino acid adenylation domain-containing protein, partial [Byssovorax sp.]